MQHWKRLWQDERGFVVSSELVLLGTVGVIGATVGLNMAATAVNDEMTEFAYAIRSLDQTYHFQGFSSCRACTAGSSYTQQVVEKSIQDLCAGQENRHEKRTVEVAPPAPEQPGEQLPSKTKNKGQDEEPTPPADPTQKLFPEEQPEKTTTQTSAPKTA